MKLKYDDGSSSIVEYPSPGVELLLPVNGVYYAHGSNTFAYDNNPLHVNTGDLVECRMDVKDAFIRGRVASVDRMGMTCFVVFPDDNVS